MSILRLDDQTARLESLPRLSRTGRRVYQVRKDHVLSRDLLMSRIAETM
jgi:hypothetical protein